MQEVVRIREGARTLNDKRELPTWLRNVEFEVLNTRKDTTDVYYKYNYFTFKNEDIIKINKP